MATIVPALWLTAERALFSCNDRALRNLFLGWTALLSCEQNHVRVGENNRKDGQSTTVFSITERKTSIHTDILYCIALHCIVLYCILLYSWRFSCYSVPIHWLVHGHMASNNEPVSRQMPWAGNFAKTKTFNEKQFTITGEMFTAVARDRR